MSEKVKIPQKVAETIEKVWDRVVEKNIVIRHLYLTNWAQIDNDVGEQYSDLLGYYAQEYPITYMRALVEGYEIEDEKYVVDIVLQDGTILKKCYSLFAESEDCRDIVHCKMSDLKEINKILSNNGYTVSFKNHYLESCFESENVIEYKYHIA